MNDCIYYKENQLNFNKQEHIFPKCIGGQEKLPLGWVSDEANEFFANNLEIKTFRKSSILIGRYIHGFNKKPSKEKLKNRTFPEYIYNTELDSRTFGKIAINALAKLKGRKFIQHPNFDEFKKWILKGNNDLFHCKMGEEKLTSNIIFPHFVHYCVYVQHNNDIIVDVCLYNHWHKMFNIGHKFDNSFDIPIGYICDWKNKMEYPLIEYLLKLNT